MRKASLLIIFLTGCFGVVSSYAIEEDRISESRMVIKQFASELKGELIVNLKEGGPINAISVCSEKASMIADRISQEKGWKIGRVSLRLRNPRNAPDAWERKALEAFEESSIKGADIKTLEYYETLNEGGKQVFRYMKAIPVGEPCLTCHGKQIELDLKAKLKEVYPGDQAIDFSFGEIIGAFSISQSK